MRRKNYSVACVIFSHGEVETERNFEGGSFEQWRRFYDILEVFTAVSAITNFSMRKILLMILDLFLEEGLSISIV